MTDWAFIFKAVFAALLSMGIAMQLEIDQPRIAILTVFIVMQPQSGAVLAKSVWRLLGTFAGCVVSLILFATVAQQPALLMTGLACWVGICTAGAARYRNHAPYGFVLAGYTACIVMMPLVEQPLQVFEVATDRLATVSLGIFCAGLVSAVIFPQHSAVLLMRSVDQRFREFIRFVSQGLTGALSDDAIKHTHLRFTSDVIGFESYRGFAAFEDPHILTDSGRLRRLNAEFMSASTRFHALTGLMERLRREDRKTTRYPLQKLFAEIAPILDAKQHGVRMAQRLQGIKDSLLLHAMRSRALLLQAKDSDALRDYDTAVELLFRFIGDLRAYAGTHESLGFPAQEGENNRLYRYIPKTDGAASLMSGLRAGLVTLLLGWFWSAAQWPSGASSVVFGGTAVALCAISPMPQRAARHAVLAGVLVAVNGFICDYLVMPHIDGFWLLCFALTPFMMVGPWLLIQPNWTGAGIMYNLFFCFVAGPANAMRYDPVQFVNYMLALLVGFTLAAVSFLVLVPPDSGWLMRHRMRNLRRLAVQACNAPLKGLAHYFASATRDMVHYMAIGQWSAPARKEELLDWAFPVLEVGHAVIELRAEIASPDFPPHLAWVYDPLLTHIGELFETPEKEQLRTTISALDKALAVTLQAGDHSALPVRHALRHAVSYLHFIRTALLDTPVEEVRHAA